jgi:hypothetical protein
MILQLGGVGNLIAGISTAVSNEPVEPEIQKGKFEFCLQ